MLDGFCRRLTPETGYFRAIEQADAVIVGLVLSELEPMDFAILDGFENVESGEYERIEVGVKTVASGRECRAWVYVGG